MGVSKLRHACADIHIDSPLTDGKITDWDRVEALWSAALRDMDPSGSVHHPMLVSTSEVEDRSARARYAELLFERFEAPCVFFAPQPMLSAFSVGRPTALVCNLGAGPIDASPVYGGYVLRDSVQVSSAGGDFIDACLAKQLVRMSPRGDKALVKLPSAAHSVGGECLPSYLKWLKSCTVQDVKHTVCRVWTERV